MKFLNHITVFIGLTYYYLGPLRPIVFIVYIISLLKYLISKPKIKLIEIGVFFYLCIKLLLGITQVGIAPALLYFRLFWGFLFFYLFFKSTKIDLTRVFILLSFITIAEYIAIHFNTGLINILPNYLQKDVIIQYFDVVGWLGGAYSFGGNRTVSGVILVALFSYFDQQGIKGRWWIFIASILTFSAVAFGLICVYLILTNLNLLKRKLFALIILFLTSLSVIFIIFSENEAFYRLSFAYLTEVIIEFKLNQIKEALLILDGNILNILFGIHEFTTESEEIEGYGINFNDFMWLEFLVQYGVVGFIAMLSISLSRLNINNFWPIFILMSGTFHYHIIFSTPGQLIFAYFLLLNKNNKLEK